MLGSGSGGNATLLTHGDAHVLVDAGLSCRDLCRRLEQVGVEPDALRAIVITHAHGDHTRGARLLSRRYGLPVHTTAAALCEWQVDDLHDWRELVPSRPLDLCGLRFRDKPRRCLVGDPLMTACSADNRLARLGRLHESRAPHIAPTHRVMADALRIDQRDAVTAVAQSGANRCTVEHDQRIRRGYRNRVGPPNYQYRGTRRKTDVGQRGNGLSIFDHPAGQADSVGLQVLDFDPLARLER